MPFDDLTQDQRQLITNLVERLATGSFDSEFFAQGSLNGWSIDLSGKDGAEGASLSNFTKTDLIALSHEGYITLLESDKYSYTASLKPKAYEQYKLSKQSETDIDVNRININNNYAEGPFGDVQLSKIAESSKELVAELQKNYDLSRSQANQWFLWTLGVAIFGFVLIALGVAIAFLRDVSLANITSISGILMEFIAAIFFRQADQSNKRQDTYHRDLLRRQQILDAVQLAALINDATERNNITEEIVKSLIGVRN